jgi:hypothetical protein
VIVLTTEFRTFGCIHCGAPYPAVRPDDIHVVVIPNPCSRGDSIEMPIECNNCHQRNIIHWDRVHHDDEDRFNRIANVSP